MGPHFRKLAILGVVVALGFRGGVGWAAEPSDPEKLAASVLTPQRTEDRARFGEPAKGLKYVEGEDLDGFQAQTATLAPGSEPIVVALSMISLPRSGYVSRLSFLTAKGAIIAQFPQGPITPENRGAGDSIPGEGFYDRVQIIPVHGELNALALTYCEDRRSLREKFVLLSAEREPRVLFAVEENEDMPRSPSSEAIYFYDFDGDGLKDILMFRTAVKYHGDEVKIVRSTLAYRCRNQRGEFAKLDEKGTAMVEKRFTPAVKREALHASKFGGLEVEGAVDEEKERKRSAEGGSPKK